VLLDFLYNFSETFLILRRIQRDVIIQYICHHSAALGSLAAAMRNSKNSGTFCVTLVLGFTTPGGGGVNVGSRA
jgi:hypothetical protein